jgi:N-acetyl-anhydromuramyl-L-alanine amidase AmpD
MKIQEFINIEPEKFSLIQPFFTQYNNRSLSTINTIVLHWTGGASINSDINTLNTRKLGYHFLIDKKGIIYQGAKLSKRVGHSGNSYGPNGSEVNSYSIGISFSMRGADDIFTDEAIESCVKLINDVCVAIPTIEHITGHHWISPGRKTDPYTLDFKGLNNKLNKKLNIWKTGDKPFPLGLTKDFIGQGGQNYSKDKISTEISDFLDSGDLSSE